MNKVGSAPDVVLLYTKDLGTWHDFIPGTTTITLENVNDKTWIKAGHVGNTQLGNSDGSYNEFVMTGKIAASGSIMSLLDGTVETYAINNSYCFCHLFDGCSSLTTAPELPATRLLNYCYRAMFQNCTSLAYAPELPAMTLANSCYINMFQGCTSLIVAPELPATTLAS